MIFVNVLLKYSIHFSDISARERREFDVSHMRINTGTHTLKLYTPPVPEVSRLPLEDLSMRDYKRYGKGTIRIHVFHGTPRPGSLTPSELSDDPEDNLPEVSLRQINNLSGEWGKLRKNLSLY